MDGSGRRGGVLVWAITAGVLLGGPVSVGAPPAMADRGGIHDHGPNSDRGSADGGAPAPEPGPGATGDGRPPHNGRPGPSPEPPCPMPWYRPIDQQNNSAGVLVEAPEAAPVTPVATFGGTGARAGTDPDIPDLSPEPAAGEEPGTSGGGSGAVAPTAAVPVLLFATPTPPSAPMIAGVFSPVGAPLSPARPDAVPPAARRPAAVPVAPAAPAVPPVGYAGDLRNADLGRIASSALPGLAAMTAMTVLGGFLGYRQARAGFLLRAAGAGRFLQ